MGLRSAVGRLVGGVALLVSAACGALIVDESIEPTPISDDGGSDGPIQEAASPPDAAPPPAPACSVSPAPSCEVEKCERRRLHVSAVPGAPHGIVSDEKYVYWLEQPATNEGYNGHVEARVLRVDKVGATDESRTTVLAKAQMAAIAIALDGGWLYWTVYEKGNEPVAKLRRVRADCGPVCPTPEEFAVLPPGKRIMKLVRGGPGMLFGVSEAGDVFRFTDEGDDVKAMGPLVTKKGVGSVIATNEHVYAAGLQDPTIARMDTAGASISPAFITLPRLDAGDQGVSQLWTDCTDAWATRGASTVLRLTLADAGVETSDTGFTLSPYGFTGDASYLYIAGANEGFAALGRGMNVLTLIFPGKVWGVAVDAEGVYWGDHDTNQKTAGTIHMMVK